MDTSFDGFGRRIILTTSDTYLLIPGARPCRKARHGRFNPNMNTRPDHERGSPNHSSSNSTSRLA